MKQFFYNFVVFFGLFFLTGCDSDYYEGQEYDNGYDAGWEERKLSAWASKEEKKGYEDGLNDAWMSDEGYYDGINGKKPQYINDSFYMDGYKDGKNNR